MTLLPRWRRALLMLAVLAMASPGIARVANSTEPTNPEAHGFSTERLGRLDAAIEEAITRQQLAGAIAYLARDGQTAYLKSYGWRDREAGTPMSPDTIFRIASMSKAVTTVAVMMLYEEGRFLLNDPVYKYLPEFRNSVVAVPPGTEGASLHAEGYATVPAKNPISIRHLLTHTAGLTYGDGLAKPSYEKARLTGWYLADKNETIAQVVGRLAALPLHGHPGESWQYGYATDVLGRLVEVVSGMPLDRFFAERILAPLQMKDTSFFLPPEKLGRLAPVYGIEKGQLTLVEPAAKNDYVQGPRSCFSGGAGLLSTVGDYGRFLQMLLNGGELEGVRLLSPKTVELMRTNHIGDKFRRDTDGFGLGFWMIGDLGFSGELGTPGAYGWGSAYYPQYFIDPKERLVGIIMAQLRPTGGLDLNQRFKVLSYQALVK